MTKSSAPSNKELAENVANRLATEFLAEFIDSKGRDCVSYTKAGIQSIIKSLESSAPELEELRKRIEHNIWTTPANTDMRKVWVAALVWTLKQIDEVRKKE